MYYLFDIGIHKDLSAYEIDRVFSRHNIQATQLRQEGSFVLYECAKEIDVVQCMHDLGGTVKIAKALDSITSLDAFASHLESLTDGKIVFSVTGAGKRFPMDVKKILKQRGRSVRVIEPKNTATVLHNNLVEKQSAFTKAFNMFFVTEAIQPIEQLGKRDYGRPARDDMSGMLPPKLAKIMLNFANIQPDDVLLDPYCGSGTVLMEGALLGIKHIHGTDLSEKAVADAQANISWLQTQYLAAYPEEAHWLDQNESIDIEKVDVTQIDKQFDAGSIDVIVSEPFMGKPLHGKESRSDLEKQANELKKLYVRAFSAFHNILSANGRVVIIIPQFKHGNDWITINCLKEIKNIGFDVKPMLEKQSLLYHRANQHVGRMIWTFVKA